MWSAMAVTTGDGMSAAPALFRWTRFAVAGVSARHARRRAARSCDWAVDGPGTRASVPRRRSDAAGRRPRRDDPGLAQRHRQRPERDLPGVQGQHAVAIDTR